MEQSGDDGCANLELAFAQHPQQVLARMGELFKALEAEEAGGSLDGMHRTEDVCQQGGIVRPLFQVGQAALHAVQAFLAFDQEFSRQFIHCVDVSAFRRKKPARNLPMPLSDEWVLT